MARQWHVMHLRHPDANYRALQDESQKALQTSITEPFLAF